MGSQMRCVVPDCNYMDQEYNKFHGFPKDTTRCRAWTDFCGRTPSRPKPLEGICDRHFREEDYQPSYKVLRRPRKWWKLKLDAVPSLFGPEVSAIEEEVIEEAPEDIINMDIISLDHLLETKKAREFEQETELLLPATKQCRLCMKVPEEMDETAWHLFEDQIDEESLATHVFNFFQLQLDNFPDWPSTVCGTCVQFLGQMKGFKETIMASHHQLYNAIHEVAMNETTEAPMEDGLNSVAPVEETQETAIQEDLVFDDEDDDDHGTNEREVVAAAEINRRTTTRSRSPRKKKIHVIVRSPEEEEVLQQLMRDMDVLKCRDCGQSQASMEELSSHMRKAHEASHTFIVCCGRKRRLYQSALEHMEYHLNRDAFRCALCDERFMDNMTLKEHTLWQHEQRKFQCQSCPKVFTTRSKQECHEKTHLPNAERPNKCGYCPAGFVDKQSLRRHTERKHEIKERYTCDLCAKAFSSYGTFHEHYNMRHGEMCVRCKKRVPDISDHMRKKHGLEMDDAEWKRSRSRVLAPEVQCDICDEVVEREQITAHRRGHTTHPCRLCHTVTQNYKAWCQHMRRHHLADYQARKR